MKRKPELFEDKISPGDWRVERLDPDGEGAVDVAIFSGANAQLLAIEYFYWQNDCDHRLTARAHRKGRGLGKLRLVLREVGPRG